MLSCLKQSKFSYKNGKRDQFFRDRKGFKKYNITKGKNELTTPYLNLKSLNRGGISLGVSGNHIPHLIFDYVLTTHQFFPSEYFNKNIP